MSLTPEQVRGIAHLARLAISTADEARYATSLSRILDFVAALDSADVTGIAPMAHPLEALSKESQRRRPDLATEPDVRDQAQANAPKVQAGLYLVPKVIE